MLNIMWPCNLRQGQYVEGQVFKPKDIAVGQGQTLTRPRPKNWPKQTTNIAANYFERMPVTRSVFAPEASTKFVMKRMVLLPQCP